MKRFASACALLLTLAAAPAWAIEPVYTGWFSNAAVDGYDVVAYFDQGRPVKGKDEFSTKWKGAEWHFASAEHLEAFKANPEKYAPQYGGYCAWAVAHDDTASAEPDLWTIVDGKLYLNYNKDIQDKWQADKEELIKEADRNWPGILKE